MSRGSSSTTSLPPHVQVPRLVTRLVVDYFDYAARPVASTRRAARRATRRRLLRLCCASGCLGTSRDTSRGSSSTTSLMPRVLVPLHVARLVTRLVAARRRLLRLRRTSGCLGTSRDSSRGSSRRSSSTTSHMPCVRVPRHVARLVAPLVVDYFSYAARPGASARSAARRRLLRLRRASGCLDTSHGLYHRSSSTTSRTPCVRVPRHVVRVITRFVVDYFDYAARPGASTRHAARRVAHHRLLRLAQARRRLLHLRRASGCFGTSHGLSRDSSSTTSPRAGSSSTISPTPRVRVPRHVARLITQLVIDYFASRRLVVEYFTYATRPVSSARRAACHATHHQLLRLAQARRRLLHLRYASGCLNTSCNSSRGLSSTTSPPPCVRVPRHVARLVVDYFASAARPGASAHCAARRVARRRLLRLRCTSSCFGTSRGTSRGLSLRSSWTTSPRTARRRLLHLRRMSGFFGTSRGLSRDSSSTTSPRVGSSSTTLTTPRVRLLRHVVRLVVDYFASATRLGASARHAARRAARR
jgi:hypothetical protein